MADALRLVQQPPPQPEPTALVTELQAPTLSPAWPLKLPLDLLCTGLLAFALWLPWAASRPLAISIAMFAVPAVVCAFGLRVCFEALVFRLRTHPRTTQVAVASAGTAVLAGVLAAALSLIESAHMPLAAAVQAAVLVLATTVAAALVRTAEGRVGVSTRRVFFVGSDSQYLDLAREANRRGDLWVSGRMTLAQAKLCPQQEVVRHIRESHSTTLVLSAESIRDEAMVAIASELHLSGLRVRALSDFYEQQFAKIPVSDLSNAWFLFDVAEIHRAKLYGALKRAAEALVSAVLLVLSAPLLPFLALAVVASGSGPVLHRNVRVGKDGRLIRLTKFRTMELTDDTEQTWATTQSSRITPIGRWMRKYRFDEIPQLWHVMRGDLSLVGPRPEQPEIVKHLQDTIEFYAARHRVRPGITGWAQVNHGYAGSVEDTIEKLQYEFFYIKRQSLSFDLLILLATIRTILAGGGQ